MWRIAFPILLLMIVSLTGFGQAVESTPTPSDEIVFEVYDLTSMLSRYPSWDVEPTRLLSLVPFHPAIQEASNDSDQEFHYELNYGEETIHEILRALIGDEVFDREGTLIEISRGRLIVHAPPDVQEWIRVILAFLDENLNRKIRLEIEVFRAFAGTDLSKCIDENGIDAFLEDGSLVEVASTELIAEPGEMVRFRNGSTRDMVYRLETEIAQASVVNEARMEPLETGVRIQARPFITENGRDVGVGLYVLDAHLLKPMRLRPTRQQGRIASDGSIEEVTMSHYLDDPKIAFASFAAPVRLHDLNPGPARFSSPVRLIIKVTREWWCESTGRRIRSQRP